MVDSIAGSFANETRAGRRVNSDSELLSPLVPGLDSSRRPSCIKAHRAPL